MWGADEVVDVYVQREHSGCRHVFVLLFFFSFPPLSLSFSLLHFILLLSPSLRSSTHANR